MPDYIAPPLVTEPADLADESFAYLEAQVDGWLPSPGNLDTWMVESIAQLAGELMDVASAVPASIFRYFGATLLNLPPAEAVSATGITSWVVRDSLGYTIPAGTLVGIPADGDELVPFETAADAVIPPGSVGADGVVIIAQEPGTDANGLTGQPELVDALDFVTGVALTGPFDPGLGMAATTGGVDPESDAEYQNRLRELLQLLAPRPILPNDFAVLAKTVPGVYRATAIDLYNPGPPVTTNVPRCVTVVVVAEDGNPVSAIVRQQVDDLLQSEREVNFLVFVVDPTYTTVNVTFRVHPYPDYGGQDVVDRCVSALTDYLSPQNFGATPYGEAPQWLSDPWVRYLEVAEVINRVEGCWYIVSLTVNGGTVDVALPGVGALPKSGDIQGSWQ